MNKILIEESLPIVDYGFLCVKIGNRKCYMKLGETDKDGNTALIPLTSEELKAIGIEETAQGESEEIEIEESEEGETETERKFREEKEKAEVILKGTPESVRKAKQLLENAKELEAERDDYKEKLELQAQLAFERKKKELGCSDSEIDTADKLIAWEKGKSGHENAGSAPMNDAQLGQGETSDIGKKKFASHAEMVRFLKDNSEDPNVKHYIDLLWKRAVQSMKTGQKIEYNPQSEAKNESDQPIEIKDWSQLKIGKSEIGEMLERANQKARNAIHLQSERRVAQQEKAREAKEREKEVGSK